MKTLYLLRHAKAEAASMSKRDVERGLADQGRSDAGRMGVYFQAKGYACDGVLCSTARRTRETQALMMPQTMRVTFEEGLYLAEDAALLQRVCSLSDSQSAVLLIGHNPGIGELAGLLTAFAQDERSRQLRGRLGAGFPTCALAVVGFQAEKWVDVKAGGGALIDFMRPRDL